MHNLRITEDMVKDGKIECTPLQFEYLKIVKWFEEQMDNLAAKYRKPEDEKKEEISEDKKEEKPQEDKPEEK